ncbi:MAG: hypothetical protein UR66_C0001G0053 [Candidatus Moranbacteria bacterium GW2011_GWE1_35_17]|nr:MAG: hypothetical protein UR66_C0001G0053 [Candidatus Moranbacteria bacterium GW2011_GWE1_35_17]KKP73483.1 MAG: hypothetical protein UR65_C0003G0007 [Candidatus Moranbacteria bacterium GW2011_GWE2_35_164]KKP83398.1 MAG: hypothetical protein UR82_C0021G0028 [Candidatus Moranbacteria bacterium GW2011_GWF1_35_5]KKP85229.1 MAG: hypothetical protein UR83_C0003G0064 [Candidatus Moranbacteria bacterium GW2011_GWF2_35_54]
MEKNPAQKIIEKIKQEKIVPESKIFLNWKNYLFWFIWMTTLFLGAIFFSFIILNLLDIHPSVIRQLGLGRIFFILARTAPYLWIVLAILAGVSGFLAIKKTKRGYRYSILFITSIGVLIISMLGAFLHLAKINRHMGEGKMFNRPMSRGIAFPVEKRWQDPQEGLLGGKIIKIDEEFFNLRGFDNEVWEVRYSNETEFKIRKMEENIMVAIIGEKIGEHIFKASLVLPPPFDRKPDRR